MSANGAQFSGFWAASQPFTLITTGYALQISSVFTVSSGNLDVNTNGIKTVHIDTAAVTSVELAAGAVGPSHINFGASDIDYNVTYTIADMIDRSIWADGSKPLTADWDVNSFKITGVPTPTVDADVTNKNYVDTEIKKGQYHRAPVVSDQLQSFGLRAGAAYYFDSQPNDGDQITVHGVTFTFVSGAPASSTEIEIQGTLADTVVEAETVLNACTDLDLEGDAFNTDFLADRYNYYLYIIVLSEDPPNTPSDGNTKTISTSNTSVKLAHTFRGGKEFDWENTGTIVLDLTTSKINKFDYGIGWTTIT